MARFVLRRLVSTEEHAGRAKIDPRMHERTKAIGVWAAGVVIGMLGLSYAFVPLYRMFCQATGYAGTANESDKGGGVALQNLSAVAGSRVLTIEFTSDVSPNLSWKFEPMQRLVRVQPGTAAPPVPCCAER
jgi:cytochrome c oxidase assembly protein subunit 11